MPTINGTSGNDTLNGTDGDDAINGLGGNDTINGGWGNDTVDAGAGDDTLQPDADNDILQGGDGDDIIYDWSGDDVIDGGAGIDTVTFVTSGINHVVNLGSTTIEWKRGDTFCIPLWTPYEHRAVEKTYLFRFDDRPALRALGWYRTEAAA